jgi:hypothetical protein
MNAVTPFERAAGPVARAGQGTLVEQSRAVAEVQAAVVVAQQRPRDVTKAISEMRASTGMPYLAERAFFRFPRGGQTVSGKSVHLARELARCWGNIVYGVKELSRDDAHGQSEMMAYAWDIETNARNETVFIVPHLRDKRGGPERLVDMRDIYENNANNGARRLRECILGVLPPWYVEEAADRCMTTLKDGGGKPLVQRIADCIAKFEAIGVTKGQLEQRTGRKAADLTAEDVAQLGVIFKSIQRGEIDRHDEFPREERQTPANADAFEAAAAGQTQAPKDEEAAPAADGKRPSRTKAETAAPKPPNSPLTGGGNWPAWTKWFIDEIGRTPAHDVGKLLLDHGAEVDWLETNDPLGWADIQRAIDKRREEG